MPLQSPEVRVRSSCCSDQGHYISGRVSCGLHCSEEMAETSRFRSSMMSICLFVFLIFLFYFIIVYSITVVPTLFALLHPSLPPTPTVHPHSIVVHVRGSFIHVLWLFPSPSFQHSSPAPFLWQLSVCSLFQKALGYWFWLSLPEQEAHSNRFFSNHS